MLKDPSITCVTTSSLTLPDNLNNVPPFQSQVFRYGIALLNARKLCFAQPISSQECLLFFRTEQNMFGHELVFCDVDEKVALLEMFGCDTMLRKRLKGTHGRGGYGANGDENTVGVVSIKMLGKLSKMFDSDGWLWAKLDPNIACCSGRVWLCFGRKRRVKLIHSFAWFCIEAHKFSA
jgi:hypothetical protein